MFKSLKIKFHKQRGFTLIELLIAIAIIVVLSSLTLANYSTSRMKARDAQRINDLTQIKTALELFYNHNGYYPQSNCGWDCNEYRVSYNSSWDSLATDLAPYLSPLPKDPINTSNAPWNANSYSYAYGNVGRTTYKPQYDLTTQLEDPLNPQRCAIKQWKFYFDSSLFWCGNYSSQIYEASSD
jgi:prepilin-type N-terminal cleavage/methylation domain-containing protein